MGELKTKGIVTIVEDPKNNIKKDIIEEKRDTLTNENKILKACLSSKELNEIFYDQPGSRR
jgi:hypothetical protein